MHATPSVDQLQTLGKAQAAAGAAFLADPSPLNRAAYTHAIRRTLRAQFAGQPKAIRYLDRVYREILDAMAPATAGREAAE